MHSTILSEFIRSHTTLPSQFLAPSIKIEDLKGLTVFNQVQLTNELMDKLNKVDQDSPKIIIDSVILDKE